MASNDKRTVSVNIVGDASSYKRAMSEAEQQTGKSGAVMTGIFSGIGIGATQLATEGIGKVVDFLGESSKKAREDETVTARLTTALRDGVQGFQGTADVMGASLESGKKLGFADDEVAASLAKLVPATHDVAQSQRDSALAMDLARARGIDLSAATDMVVKAQVGQLGPLTRQGIALTAVTSHVDALRAAHTKATPEQLAAAKAADKQATATAALAALQKLAGGQAEAYAGTQAGQLAVASATVEGIQQRLGATLNQMIATILPPLVAGLGQVADWFGQVAAAAQPFVTQAVQLGGQVMAAVSAAFAQIVAAVQPLIPVIQTLAGEYLSLLVAEFQTVASFVTGTLVPAFTSIVEAVQPLIPVIQTLAGEYLSLLLAEFQTVASFVTGTLVPAFTSIVEAVLPPLTAALKWLADDVIPSVSSAFQYIAGKVLPLIESGIGWIVKNVLPPLGTAFDVIVKNVLPPVVTALRWVADNVLPALGTAFGVLTDTVIPAISDALQAMGKLAGDVMGGIGGTVKTMVNAVIDGINAMIRAVDAVKFDIHIPNPMGGSFDFGFAGVNLPQIPHLASGTSGAAGGWALLGENGPELARLPSGTRVMPAGQTSRALAAGGADATGGITINFYPQTLNATDAEASAWARRLWSSLEAEARRRGMALGAAR